MNADELFAMLDITPGEVQTSTVKIDYAKPGTDFTVETIVSPYALQLDEWDVAQGERCLIESRHFENVSAQDAADFFAVYFHQRPQLNKAGTICADAERADFIATLMNSPEYFALHEQTRANPYESMMAAGILAETFSKTRKSEDEPQDPQEGNNASEDGQGAIDALLAAHEAIRAAQEEVDTLNAVKSALGCDNSEATGGNVSPAEVQRFFQTVKDNPQLRRIMELAGKYRRVAQSEQRAKKGHGLDDVVGVEQDNDVSRLLPMELARLADEDLELDMLRRFAESQTVCRKHEAPEPEGRGPVVVCVDESGSMRGEKIAQAKAFALAMAWIARHQKRYCALVAFAEGRQGRVLVLEPGQWDQKALLGWLSDFIGGGTTMNCPLGTVPRTYWTAMNAPKGKTDMVMLTDGIVPVSYSLRTSFNEWKAAESVSLTTLIVGTRDRGELGSVSDELHNVDTMTIHNKAVRSCMAI